MHPYSPISWLYVHGFLDQNVKQWILGLLLDIRKSGSVCFSLVFIANLDIGIKFKPTEDPIKNYKLS